MNIILDIRSSSILVHTLKISLLSSFIYLLAAKTMDQSLFEIHLFNYWKHTHLCEGHGAVLPVYKYNVYKVSEQHGKIGLEDDSSYYYFLWQCHACFALAYTTVHMIIHQLCTGIVYSIQSVPCFATWVHLLYILSILSCKNSCVESFENISFFDWLKSRLHNSIMYTLAKTSPERVQ